MKISLLEKEYCNMLMPMAWQIIYNTKRIKFQDARNKLIHTVNEIFDLSARTRRSQLSENLLLAPMSVGVTRNKDKDIKAAFFQFNSETEVEL